MSQPAPDSAPSERPSILGRIGQIWGVVGIVALLGSAVLRLTPYAVEAVTSPLTALQWAALVVYVGFMAHAEGYKGFQKQFSPRVVARAQWLRDHPRPWLVLLAPAFCMGLIHATRKRLIVSWAITTMVVVLVVLVKLLDQPWRGIVDAGVVVGLAWGLIALGAWQVAAWRSRPLPVPPDVPEP